MLENIKNFSDIVFSIVGSLVAILTYVAAKETILQPVRTEVIKKQTDLLIEIISLIDNEIKLSEKIDYQGVIAINTFGSLLLCGCVFDKQEEVKEFVKNNSKGGFFNVNSNLDEYELVSIFKEKNKEDKTDEKRYYRDAKNGKFTIGTVQVTKGFVDFCNELQKIERNPFLPKRIKKLIEQLGEDIQKNLMLHLKSAVESAVNESFARGENNTPDIVGVYNDFNHRHISHSNLILKINRETRKYLKIDSMP